MVEAGSRECSLYLPRLDLRDDSDPQPSAGGLQPTEGASKLQAEAVKFNGVSVAGPRHSEERYRKSKRDQAREPRRQMCGQRLVRSGAAAEEKCSVAVENGTQNGELETRVLSGDAKGMINQRQRTSL